MIKKGNFPFDLIHFNVWKPILEYISRAKWFVIWLYPCQVDIHYEK